MKKTETNLERENQWDAEYAPGVTCRQIWSLLNGGDAAAILSDATLTQREILAQKDLTNKEVERLVRKGVGDEVFDEYYLGPESEGSEDEQYGDDEGDPDYEKSIHPEEQTPRNVTPDPGRTVSAPRRLRFREDILGLENLPGPEVVHPVEVNEINQHLEALHLGTPGQRRPNVSVRQVHSSRQPECCVERSPATLEELMRKDHELILLKAAKLKKNTTVKGKVRELVRYGEQVKISAESVDAQILAEFGLQGR